MILSVLYFFSHATNSTVVENLQKMNMVLKSSVVGVLMAVNLFVVIFVKRHFARNA
jgi:hypothetical protein